LLLHRMPCAYRTERAFCVLEKASHHKHRLYKPDPHKAPKFKDKKSAFMAPDIDIEHLRQKFTAYAKDLLAVRKCWSPSMCFSFLFFFFFFHLEIGHSYLWTEVEANMAPLQ